MTSPFVKVESADDALLTLPGEKFGPGNNFWMLLQQCATLTFRHAAPHAEFHAVVERIRATFRHHRAMPANYCSLTLRCPPNKQLIGIRRSAQSLRYPGDASLPFRTRDCNL